MNAAEAVVARYRLAVAQWDLAVADEIIDLRFQLHSPGIPADMSVGPESMKMLAETIAIGAPDRRIVDHDTMSSRDRVLVRWTLQGTHDGELFGLPRTGRTFSIDGLDLYRVAGGKITDLWQAWDQFGLFQQLGALHSSAPL